MDMSTLTQSELRSLSSAYAFELNRLDDVVIPALIVPSSTKALALVNKPSLVPPPPTAATTTSATALLGFSPPPNSRPPPPSRPISTPEHLENRSILNFLRQSLSQRPRLDDVVSLFSLNSVGNEHEQVLRKRGRKPKTKVKSMEDNLEIVNKDGMLVDIVGLGNLEDPFGEELRRRTEGLGGSEEELLLLGFMRDLGGQWCSRRKKRKIVDANVVGNTLPIGWKLLLGLRRREGRASVYCRRYISPGGQHFLSCKEVSGYLQSYFGLHVAQLLSDHGGDCIQ